MFASLFFAATATGHAALCELNYTPRKSDGSVDISKALQVNTEFDLSRQLWAYLVKNGAVKDPKSFIHPVPHMTEILRTLEPLLWQSLTDLYGDQDV